MADYIGGDMIRGHIDTIILNSLIDGDKDTNQIRTEIEERAAGQFQLKQGTFYSALQRIVKQGYVIEYRTSGSDGVRRKFFQLTEKGKDHIEKTQSSWTMSQQVLNTLMDTEQQTPNTSGEKNSNSNSEDEKLPAFDDAPVITDFADLGIKAENVASSTAEETLNSIDEFEIKAREEEQRKAEQDAKDAKEAAKQAEFDNIQEISSEDNESGELLNETTPVFNPENDNNLPQTFDDILEILERVDRRQQEAEDRKLKEEQEAQQELLKKQQEEELQKEEVQKESAISDESQCFEEENSTETIDDCSKNRNLSAQHEVETEKLSVLTQPADQVENTQTKESIKQTDDYLDSDNLPLQSKYKEVLAKIFEKEDKDSSSPAKNIIEFPTKENNEEQSVKAESSLNDTNLTPENQESDENFDVIVENLDFSANPEESKTKDSGKSHNKNAGKNKKKQSQIDYSDIIALSEAEGFKVTTSDRTNKSELGKILVNRLNFHTSLIFFLLIALEMLIIGLTMEKVMSLGFQFYIYFGLIALIFPIICGAVYYMAPKRTIAEVNPFKNAFEMALIITLNIVLIILVYVVIIDLDFSSKQAVARNLFLPLILVLNIPFYVVIRYSLLEKQMYFS